PEGPVQERIPVVVRVEALPEDQGHFLEDIVGVHRIAEEGEQVGAHGGLDLEEQLEKLGSVFRGRHRSAPLVLRRNPRDWPGNLSISSKYTPGWEEPSVEQDQLATVRRSILPESGVQDPSWAAFRSSG